MRKLILILSLIFTVTLSSPSYAKWTMVREVSSGYVFVDLERIQKKDDGNVYTNINVSAREIVLPPKPKTDEDQSKVSFKDEDGEVPF